MLPSELPQSYQVNYHKVTKWFGGFGKKYYLCTAKKVELCDQICSKNSLNTLEQTDNFR